MKKKTKIITAVSIMAVLLIPVIIWTVWANTALVVSEYTVESEDLPDAFDGFRIVHISDIHNRKKLVEYEGFLDIVKEAEPDMIAFTGDIIDSSKGIDNALDMIKDFSEIAPCYYITGNHEGLSLQSAVYKYEDALEELGVTVLHNESVTYEKNGEAITVAGLDDPVYIKKFLGGNGKAPTVERIKSICESDNYTVLLSHRPEFFERYVEADVDLVLSGHAHGGQARLPLIGGLVAPGQGIFPKYDAGLFEEDGTSMALSRGIGNSKFPLRFNNPPEIVVVELKTK